MRISRKRRRHPCDKGHPYTRALNDAFRFLFDGRTWRRHPEPFAKTERGKQRREIRRFVRTAHDYEVAA